MYKTRLLGAAFAAAMVAGLPAHAQDTGVTATEIVIGMHNPLSGQLAAFGYDPLHAAKMWFDQVNAKGGIHGRKIRTIVEDDKCVPNDAVAIVKKFITVDKVFLINGGACTAAAVAVQAEVEREKVPFVMINAAGDGALFPPTRYMFGGPGGTQKSVGATLGEFAVSGLKGKRIALLVDDNDFGTSNSTAARGAIERLGGQVVALERVGLRLTDLTAPVLNVRQSNPDVVLSTLYPQTAVLAAQKRLEYGLTSKPWVQAVQGIPLPELFAKNVGDQAAMKDFYYSSPLNDLTTGPKQQPWIEQYKKAYPDRTTVGAFMAYGLPHAMAITRALEAAGKDLTREKFVDAMEKTNFESGIVAGPTVFTKERRDSYRSSIFIKFDGKTEQLIPGVYTWNGTDGEKK
jgi:branched-chain amino acid transport system substrate-binding protein